MKRLEENGVGIIVDESLKDETIDIKRVGDKIILVKLSVKREVY